MLNGSTYAEKALHLERLIGSEGYYPHLWLAVCKQYGPLDGKSDTSINTMLNVFWGKLPDSAEIRRKPFFDLCDMCTEDFSDADFMSDIEGEEELENE